MNAPKGRLPRRQFIARTLAALGGAALLGRAERAAADTPHLAEIRMFAGDFAPYGWAFCDGQYLSIEEYPELYNLIGTQYGGDGQSTFALPDLRGRAPVHVGTGPDGISRTLAESGGSETVTLIVSQLPAHNHSAGANSGYGSINSPAGQVPAGNAVSSPIYSNVANASLAAGVLAPTGGSQPHNNMQPYLAVNFIISLFGVIPSQRSSTR